MSTELTFDATQDTLETLLREARKGQLQLPEFQRDWVWDDDHICSLLTSVSRSFPVGAIMTLMTGGPVRFATRPIKGVDLGPSPVAPDRLILDGQQRLTSLYQALLLGQPVETRDAQRRLVRRWYYVSLDHALGEPAAQEQAIRGIPEDHRITKDFGREVVLDLSTREREFENAMFPLHLIFDSDAWMMGWYRFWNYDPGKIEEFNRFRNQFIAAFKSYQIPIIQLRKSASKEAICLIFEKVNTGGVPLTAFELLTATFAAEGFDLREDWFGSTRVRTPTPGRAKRMFDKRRLLALLQNTEFLQAVTLLHTYKRRRKALTEGVEPSRLPPVSCTRQSILELDSAAYQANADAVEEGFFRAAQFLWSEKIFRPEDIPYRTQLIPLAVILYLLGPRWHDLDVRSRLRQWYWCGVFGELYGSATETRFARDVTEVVAWIDTGGPLPATVQDCNFAVDRLRTLRTRLSAAYKGLHALIMQIGGAVDLRTGATLDEQTVFEETIDIHHIFPRVWCERQGIPSTTYDSIVNKTPLSAATNRLLGGDAPSVYLRRLKERFHPTEEQLAHHLGSHLVEPTLLETNDFQSFILARGRRLLVLIEQATGRPVGGAPLEEVFEFCNGEVALTEIETEEAA
jgi:hypothetical protein